MNIRKNIYTLTPTRSSQDFKDALNAIKADGSYDDFIHRHHHAMMTATPMSGETPNDEVRNVAHRGPGVPALAPLLLPRARTAAPEEEAERHPPLLGLGAPTRPTPPRRRCGTPIRRAARCTWAATATGPTAR